MDVAIDHRVMRQQGRFDMNEVAGAEELVDRQRQFGSALKHLDRGRWFEIGWRQDSLTENGERLMIEC